MDVPIPPSLVDSDSRSLSSFPESLLDEVNRITHNGTTFRKCNDAVMTSLIACDCDAF